METTRSTNNEAFSSWIYVDAVTGLAKRSLVSGRIFGSLLVAALFPWLVPAAVLWCVSLLFAAAAYCAFRAPRIHAMERERPASG